MGDLNLPNIDWTLQRATPAPGNKLMQLLTDINLTQHVHETIRQHNILDLVLSMEEELILNHKITQNWRPSSNYIFNKNRKGKYSIGKKTNTLEEQISKQCGLNFITIPLNNLLLEIMPSLDLKFSRAESMMQEEDTSQKR